MLGLELLFEMCCWPAARGAPTLAEQGSSGAALLFLLTRKEVEFSLYLSVTDGLSWERIAASLD